MRCLRAPAVMGFRGGSLCKWLNFQLTDYTVTLGFHPTYEQVRLKQLDVVCVVVVITLTVRTTRHCVIVARGCQVLPQPDRWVAD